MPRKSWWARLPFGVRMTAGTTALLVLAGGGVAGVVTMTGGGEERTVATAVPPAEPDTGLGAPTLDEDPEVVSRAAAAAEPLPQRHTAATPQTQTTATTSPPAGKPSPTRAAGAPAERTGPRSPRTAEEEPETRKPARRSPHTARTHAKPPASVPVVTTRTDTETRDIPFRTQVFRDPSLPRGTREVRSEGSPGEETRRYVVTLTDGKPTGRRLVDSAVTLQPEPRIVVVGARRRFDRNCDMPLQVCLPFGRAAVCPDDGPGEQPAAIKDPEPQRLLEAGSVVLTDEELRPLDPATLVAVRPEPAPLC